MNVLILGNLCFVALMISVAIVLVVLEIRKEIGKDE